MIADLTNLAGKTTCLLTVCLLLFTSSAYPANERLNLGEFRGKVVVVDFWASWCVPCRRSFPWMNEMQEKYGDSGLVIIGVNVDSDAGEAQAFLDQYPANFSIVSDTEGTLAREYGVVAMPSSFVIGRDGEIAAQHLGFKVKKQGEYETVLVEALRNETE